MELCEALSIPRGVIALVGGGGKTTIMLRLAAELKARGRVIVSTTTHIFPLDIFTLISPDANEVEKALDKYGMICVGRMCDDGKLAPAKITPDLHKFADYILFEADGSKHMPLKAPAEHEPVLPDNAELVIAVAGSDGIGREISEAAHRPQLYADIIGKKLDDTVQPCDVAAVLMSANGQRKNVNCRYAAALNKADDSMALENARKCASLLDCETIITSFKHKEPLIELWRNKKCLWR